MVLPRAPCRGISHPPRTPSGIRKAAKALVAHSVQRMLSAGADATDIEPIPAECNVLALHHDQGDSSSPFAIPSTRDSQPLDPVAIGRFPIAQIGTRFRRGLVPIKVATC